jgi:hypothetical protein
MNKLFQWSAIATSSFVLLAALLMLGGNTEYGIDWEECFFFASTILAPICAAVCLTSAIVGFFIEKKKKSN